MTTIATTLGIHKLSYDIYELEDELLKVVNSNVTPFGKMFRELLNYKYNSGELGSSFINLLNSNIYVSETEDEKFFIDEKKGPEISFRQVIEYQYLKEDLPNTNFGFLFKNKTYSFFEKDYRSIHGFFEVLLNYGVCFTLKKIEYVNLPSDSSWPSSLYAVEFDSTARMSTFYVLVRYVSANMLHTLRPGAATLDDVDKFKFDSEEECLKREEIEIRTANADALKKKIDGGLGEITGFDNSISQEPPWL